MRESFPESGLPVLLPDQPWSRERFGDQASYFPKKGNGAVATLRQFYERSMKLPPPRVQLTSWREVGQSLREVYARLLTPVTSARISDARSVPSF